MNKSELENNQLLMGTLVHLVEEWAWNRGSIKR
jgi:hypothetical protein